MDVYAQLAKSIIEAQETLIGPVAIMQAKKVKGLNIDWDQEHTVTVEGDGTTIIEDLVDQYKTLFGQISVEVCKEAVGRLAGKMDPSKIPASLK